MAVGRDSRGFFMLESFFCWKGIVGDSAKGRLFCDVYVIWEKEGGFLTNFLILRMGNDFAAGFALRKGNFIVCSK